jgi:hypothetical protein
MNLFGITKETELEKQIGQLFDREIRATGLYQG